MLLHLPQTPKLRMHPPLRRHLPLQRPRRRPRPLPLAMFLCVVVCPASLAVNHGHPKASRLPVRRPPRCLRHHRPVPAQPLRPLSLTPTRALPPEKKRLAQAKPNLRRLLRPLRQPSALEQLPALLALRPLLQLVGQSRPVRSVILHFVVVSLVWPAGTRGLPRASPQPRRTLPPSRRRRLLPRPRLSLTRRPRPVLVRRRLHRHRRHRHLQPQLPEQHWRNRTRRRRRGQSRTSPHRTRARLPHLLRSRRGQDSRSRQGPRRRGRRPNLPPSRPTNRRPSLPRNRRPSLPENRRPSLPQRRVLLQPRQQRLPRVQPKVLHRRRRNRR